jgi:hypothetical protein
MNIRLLPPTGAAYQTIAVKGRTYNASPGTAVDVYDADAEVLSANGWVWVAPSGPSSARPVGTLGQYTNLPGSMFYDTTIGKLIISDGQAWRDPSNGNAV